MSGAVTQDNGADMGPHELGYALAKQAPAMRERGFDIRTVYGPIHVLPGLLADRIAELIEAHLKVEIHLARRSAEHAQQQRQPEESAR